MVPARNVFSRPVDPFFLIKTGYGEWNQKYRWSIDPDNGLWVPIRQKGWGQHRGIDFDCPIGTVVRAAADGIVVSARYENAVRTNQGAGLQITQLVKKPGFDSWTIRYTHLRAVYVNHGQQIRSFDPIAESGNSGDVSVPLLHVELLNRKGQPKPLAFE